MTQCVKHGKTPSNEDIEKIPSYLFCRWLSGSPYTIQAANLFNTFSKIPVVNQYNMVRTAFKGKIGYIPYPKKTPDVQTEQIKYVCEHFKINKRNAQEYLTFISKKELNEIVKMYSERDAK